MKTKEDFKKLTDYVDYLNEGRRSVELSLQQRAEVVHELIRIKEERRLWKEATRNYKTTHRLIARQSKLKPRYLKIIEIIREIKPESIIEVGTCRGNTALCMIFEALKHQKKIMYTGYDLFENITDEINKKERNAKATVTRHEVVRTFEDFISNVKVVEEIIGELEFTLIKGNTLDVLKNSYADLVFIDGGHSVETIRSDYNHVKKSKVVIFDDYYLTDQYGNIPDLTKFGCNSIVDELNNVEIFKCYEGDEEGGRIIKTAIAIKRHE